MAGTGVCRVCTTTLQVPEAWNALQTASAGLGTSHALCDMIFILHLDILLCMDLLALICIFKILHQGISVYKYTAVAQVFSQWGVFDHPSVAPPTKGTILSCSILSPVLSAPRKSEDRCKGCGYTSPLLKNTSLLKWRGPRGPMDQ